MIGRLRALETRLLNASLLERMIDAPAADDAYRVFNDLTFLCGCISEHKVNEFQIVLNKSLQKMVRLYMRMAPYKNHLNLLWLKYDFHNLKVILKARLTKRGFPDVEHTLIDIGTRPIDEWEHYLLEGKAPVLTSDMEKAIKDATQIFKKTNDPQSIDLVMDKHYMEEALKFVEHLDSDLIKKYLQQLIDFTNLKTFIRCKELKRDQQYFESILIVGGQLNLSIFTDAFDKDYEILRQTLEQKIGGDKLVLVLNQYLQKNSLLDAEKKINALLQILLDETKKMPFGPDPVFAFFWKFENHLQILRIILVGKLNGLPGKEIRENVLLI